MQRVLGIGGVFFKARDPASLGAWYRDHLGIDIEPWGGAVFHASGPHSAVWSPFPADTTYFAPSEAPFMINFRVADVRAMVDQLRTRGCSVDERIEETPQGIFGWVMDPEGNRVELWQPPQA